MHFQGWGKTVVLGVDRPGSNLTLSSGEVLQTGKTLTGCLFGGLKPKSDVPMLVKRYLDKVSRYLLDLIILKQPYLPILDRMIHLLVCSP